MYKNSYLSMRQCLLCRISWLLQKGFGVRSGLQFVLSSEHIFSKFHKIRLVNYITIYVVVPSDNEVFLSCRETARFLLHASNGFVELSRDRSFFPLLRLIIEQFRELHPSSTKSKPRLSPSVSKVTCDTFGIDF